MSTYEEKVKIKQQVFQVISNKYSSGQTDRLIEDIDKITKAITDKPAEIAEGEPAPAQVAQGEPDNNKIRLLALKNGFTLKKQPDGQYDLNPYVYLFAHALINKIKADHVKAAPKAAHSPEATTDTFLFLGGDIDGEDRNMHCDTKGMPLAAECYPSDSDYTYYRNSMEVGFNGVVERTYYFYSLRADYTPTSDKAAARTILNIITFEQTKG